MVMTITRPRCAPSRRRGTRCGRGPRPRRCTSRNPRGRSASARTHAGLAQDVVGAGRQRWPRRAAQDHLRVPAPDQICDVGVTLADRRRLDLALAEAVLVEEGLQRLEDEKRGAAVTLSLLRGMDDVVWRDCGAHRPQRYTYINPQDRNLPRSEVSLASMFHIRTLLSAETELLSSSRSAALGAGAPSAAVASHSQAMFFEAPHDLGSRGPRHKTFVQMQALGVKALRLELHWHDVALGANSARAPPLFDATNPPGYH